MVSKSSDKGESKTVTSPTERGEGAASRVSARLARSFPVVGGSCDKAGRKSSVLGVGLFVQGSMETGNHF